MDLKGKNAQPIIDVCCGGRMWHFDKSDSRTVFMDNRKLETKLCDGRTFRVSPDVIGDFRNIPYKDATFSLVLFDPPHLIRLGENSWMFKKYGCLDKTHWKEDLSKGFSECFRVLKPNGVLVFKWNETQVPSSVVIALSKRKPVIMHKKQKTHFMIFIND